MKFNTPTSSFDPSSRAKVKVLLVPTPERRRRQQRAAAGGAGGAADAGGSGEMSGAAAGAGSHGENRGDVVEGRTPSRFSARIFQRLGLREGSQYELRRRVGGSNGGRGTGPGADNSGGCSNGDAGDGFTVLAPGEVIREVRRDEPEIGEEYSTVWWEGKPIVLELKPSEGPPPGGGKAAVARKKARKAKRRPEGSKKAARTLGKRDRASRGGSSAKVRRKRTRRDAQGRAAGGTGAGPLASGTVQGGAEGTAVGHKRPRHVGAADERGCRGDEAVPDRGNGTGMALEAEKGAEGVRGRGALGIAKAVSGADGLGAQRTGGGSWRSRCRWRGSARWRGLAPVAECCRPGGHATSRRRATWG